METCVRQALPDLTPAAHPVATGPSDVGVSALFSKLPPNWAWWGMPGAVEARGPLDAHLI